MARQVTERRAGGVEKGIPELKSARLITDTAAGEPTLTDKGHKILASRSFGGEICMEIGHCNSQPWRLFLTQGGPRKPDNADNS